MYCITVPETMNYLVGLKNREVNPQNVEPLKLLRDALENHSHFSKNFARVLYQNSNLSYIKFSF